ncbi:MAG: hypothetical protein A2550_04560 [Candidatus Jacksonbacteria bacterium RIFOXYD2_FULL_43_21]|nr:MAG: hypothetical protein A2240_03460 [Candidatus Jacksonbacteria bacterium RIFOXYA2_FULL_43_12]OGY79811.1 MAG: hypothetical protein A2550_04560 [Candidatus Jacksonbacteria bacterium RIFOXYD2_FULL_43_21]
MGAETSKFMFDEREGVNKETAFDGTISLDNQNATEQNSQELEDLNSAIEFLLKNERGTHTLLEKEKILNREETINKISSEREGWDKLFELLDLKDLDIKEIENGKFELKSSGLGKLSPPPDGYGYKGGMARAILLRTLKIDPTSEPRDIDLVKIKKTGQEKDVKLDPKFMSSDGHGIEDLKDDYFNTRDFTINEAMIVGDKIQLTKQCLLDTVRRIVRFTDFEKKELHDNPQTIGDDDKPFVSNKLIAKAVRLVAEEFVRGRQMEIAENRVYEYTSADNFFIALHLDHALERGISVARAYIDGLREKGIIESHIQTPSDFIKNYYENIDGDGSFIFRFAPAEQLEKEENFFNDLAIEQEEQAQKDEKYKYLNKYGHLEKK